jgi:ABC-type phosphate transport system ATPase subunit
VCARLKRPTNSSLLGYDGKKDTTMPIVSPRAPIVPRAKAGIRFQKANVLRTTLYENLYTVIARSEATKQSQQGSKTTP